jgi:fibronectin-binding autotransporter adhesin
MAVAVAFMFVPEEAAAQYDLYWNPNGSVVEQGGSGNWSSGTVELFNATSTPSDALISYFPGSNVLFHGAAGTVQFDFALNANSLTFDTTGYTFYSSNSFRSFSTDIILGDGVNLNMFQSPTAGSTQRLLLSGSISGGANSTLTLQGGPTNLQRQRLFLEQSGATVSVDTHIVNNRDYGATPSHGLIGFTSRASGVVISGNIINNSDQSDINPGVFGVQTGLGAVAVGDSLTITGTISGNRGVRIQHGDRTGGGGVVVFASANTYEGKTSINSTSTGVLRLGIDNGISTQSEISFGAAVNNGDVGAVDLNGYDQTVTAISTQEMGTGNAVNGITNTGAGLSVLTIDGNLTRTYTGTIGVANDLTNLAGAHDEIRLVMRGSGTQTLTGNNTYSGGTLVESGTLSTGASGRLGSGDVEVIGGSFNLGNNQSLGEAASLLFSSDALISLDYAGTQTIASLIFTDTGSAIGIGTYNASQLNDYFNETIFSGGGLLEVAVPEPAFASLLMALVATGLVAVRRRLL